MYGYIYGEKRANRPFLQVLAQLADKGTMKCSVRIGAGI
jgi:hypothetical protein